METYLQYRRIGKTLEKQLQDNEEARKLPCLSKQQTRSVGGRDVLVVEWDTDDDPMNPRNWSNVHRYKAVLVISAIAFIVGAAAPIDSAVLPQAAADLNVSEVTETLAVGIFLVGFGVGALICGPFSEVLGRSFTYIVTMFSMCIWLMASALAPSIGPQIVFRFLAGFSGATPLVCAGGSISDMFRPLEKTYIFPFFSFFGFGGPALGPVMVAWVAQSPYLHTWRWTEWIALLTAGVVFFLIFTLLPETFPPTILSWKAKHLRRLTGDDRYYAEQEIERISLTHRLRTALPRPFIMAIHEPVIVLITLYMSVLYIILFTFFDGYTYIFEQTYGISQGLTNTIFVGIFVGVISGSLTVPWVYKRTLRAQQKAEQRGQKQFPPEERLWFAMLGGAPAVPVSLFWMGWTAYSGISIWSPILASVLFGYGVITIFMSCYMYLIDSYEMYAASGLTFATLVRYCCAGGMTVVGIPFYKNVGVHWTCTILGVLSLLMCPLPYVFFWKGSAIRKRSRYMVADQGQAEVQEEQNEGEKGTKKEEGVQCHDGNSTGPREGADSSESSSVTLSSSAREPKDEEKEEV